jgi:hypothetical protein
MKKLQRHAILTITLKDGNVTQGSDSRGFGVRAEDHKYSQICTI